MASDGGASDGAVRDGAVHDVSLGEGGTADTTAGSDGMPASCPVQGYAPCGGNLLGSWTFVSLCPEDQAQADALFEHPYDNLDACKDRTANFVHGSWVRQGTMTFTATEVTVKMKSRVDISYGFTDACLAVAQPAAATPSNACTSLAKPGKLSCSYAPGLCTCEGSVAAPDEDSTSPYAVADGNLLSVGSGGEAATFCQDGDVLILDWTPHPITWRYWILTRL